MSGGASDGRLEGRRLLVVGAGTQPTTDEDAPVGNGRAISVLAAREGATVACADRNRAAAEDTAAWIEREGGRCSVIAADIAFADECASISDRERSGIDSRLRIERAEDERRSAEIGRAHV